jgi:hypothetical protein
MNTNERDFHRIAFEGMEYLFILSKFSVLILDDSVYFHCPSKLSSPIQWHFLSFNYYSKKTLPVIYDTDTKIDSVKITDAGMYTCQTENTTHQRIVLTILRKNLNRSFFNSS